MWAAVYMLFAISVVIRGLILPSPHILNTYYDELLYWGVAKTFWTQPAFTIYHVPVEFSKFLYSMVLSPLFLIKDAAARLTTMGWLNGVMISCSVFPAYRLVRKLSSSRAVQLASLVLLVASPVMNYAEKFAPESLYLPLSLYLILGYYALYQRIVTLESYPMRKLCVTALLLGIFAYLIYLEKEAASAFFGAFLVWTVIAAAKGFRRKDGVWKWYLAAAGAHAAAIAVCHLLISLILGLKFSYSDQVGLSLVGSMYRIEFLIHCLISNGLYICVALFGIPVLYWQIKRNRKGRLADEDTVHYNWIVFFFVAFALTWFFISYSISLPEDFGKAKIRLHTRYYIPFIAPFFALVLEEMRRFPQKGGRVGVAGVLIVGIACVLLLNPNRYVSAYDSFDTWHIQNANSYFDDLTDDVKNDEEDAAPLKAFFADQTGGSKEISYNHGLLFSMAAFTAAMVLIVWLTSRNKRAALALFFCAVLVIECYNNVITVKKVGRFCIVTNAEAQAYAQLDRDVQEIVGDENLLIVSTEKLEDEKRTIEAFFSFDWYSALTSGLNKVMGPDGVIELNETQIPVSMTQFTSTKSYPKGTNFAYVLCTKDIRFSEDSVEQVLYSEGTGYYLYRLIDPSMLDVDYLKDYYEE